MDDDYCSLDTTKSLDQAYANPRESVRFLKMRPDACINTSPGILKTARICTPNGTPLSSALQVDLTELRPARIGSGAAYLAYLNYNPTALPACAGLSPKASATIYDCP